jgi:hypothetical protein
MKTWELSGVTLQLAGPKFGRPREKAIETDRALLFND